MSTLNLNFWSISCKESLESQQNHALRNRFLRALLCSNEISNPGYNRKTLIIKRTSILVRVCINYEQLFHLIQCTACRKCQCSSRGKRAEQEDFVFRQLYFHFSIFEIRTVSIAVHDNVHLVCISLKIDAYFSSTVVNCPF